MVGQNIVRKHGVNKVFRFFVQSDFFSEKTYFILYVRNMVWVLYHGFSFCSYKTFPIVFLFCFSLSIYDLRQIIAIRHK